MIGLEPSFRLGVGPEEIIRALHHAQRRFKDRQEKKREREYYTQWKRAYRARLRAAQCQ